MENKALARINQIDLNRRQFVERASILVKAVISPVNVPSFVTQALINLGQRNVEAKLNHEEDKPREIEDNSSLEKIELLRQSDRDYHQAYQLITTPNPNYIEFVGRHSISLSDMYRWGHSVARTDGNWALGFRNTESLLSYPDSAESSNYIRIFLSRIAAEVDRTDLVDKYLLQDDPKDPVYIVKLMSYYSKNRDRFLGRLNEFELRVRQAGFSPEMKAHPLLELVRSCYQATGEYPLEWLKQAESEIVNLPDPGNDILGPRVKSPLVNLVEFYLETGDINKALECYHFLDEDTHRRLLFKSRLWIKISSHSRMKNDDLVLKEGQRLVQEMGGLSYTSSWELAERLGLLNDQDIDLVLQKERPDLNKDDDYNYAARVKKEYLQKAWQRLLDKEKKHPEFNGGFSTKAYRDLGYVAIFHQDFSLARLAIEKVEFHEQLSSRIYSNVRSCLLIDLAEAQWKKAQSL